VLAAENCILESFGRAQSHDGLGLNLDGLASLGVTTHTRLAVGLNRASQVGNYKFARAALALFHGEFEKLFKKCCDRFSGCARQAKTAQKAIKNRGCRNGVPESPISMRFLRVDGSVQSATLAPGAWPLRPVRTSWDLERVVRALEIIASANQAIGDYARERRTQLSTFSPAPPETSALVRPAAKARRVRCRNSRRP
jgi:hypothetical protein